MKIMKIMMVVVVKCNYSVKSLEKINKLLIFSNDLTE